MSHHYYDVLMLDRAGITTEALARRDLLPSEFRNKSLMFADNSASYETAVLGTLRLLPAAESRKPLADDNAAMGEMFMTSPPTLNDLVTGLSDLGTRLNSH